MLNDKSEIKKSREIYEKYSIVDNYDDEYDDTYDSHNIRDNAVDDSTETDAKPFTTPRVSLDTVFLSSNFITVQFTILSCIFYLLCKKLFCI